MLARGYDIEESTCSWRDMVQEVYSCYGNAERVDNLHKMCVHLWNYHKDR